MNNNQQLPPNIKLVWIISTFINSGLLVIAAVVCYLLQKYFGWHLLYYAIWITLGLAVINLIVDLSLVKYRYAFWRYTITDTAVEIRSGFIFKTVVAIPIRRIQNVTLSAGPILQWQHLQEVSIKTASSEYQIDGLNPQVSEQLKQQIMHLAMEANDYDV